MYKSCMYHVILSIKSVWGELHWYQESVNVAGTVTYITSSNTFHLPKNRKSYVLILSLFYRSENQDRKLLALRNLNIRKK